MIRFGDKNGDSCSDVRAGLVLEPEFFTPADISGSPLLRPRLRLLGTISRPFHAKRLSRSPGRAALLSRRVMWGPISAGRWHVIKALERAQRLLSLTYSIAQYLYAS